MVFYVSSLSKEAFGHLLHFLHHYILPTGNKLPYSYARAYSLIKNNLIEPNEYHACINDCVLFKKDYKDMTSCPVCGNSRYIENSQIPQKKFKYLPLLPQIKQMFSSYKVSQLLQCHLNQTDSVLDIHDSSAWKSWYSEDGYFGGDARGISFALCADGVNPFSKEKCQYSMWPLMLNILNFPYYIQSKAESLLLVGIIPGRKEPKKMDPYLEVIVDDIHFLSGQTIYNSLKDEYFVLKANIILMC